MATILVTGAAGFIGAAVSHALLARGDVVMGVDNLSDYYDPRLKDARLAQLAANKNFSFRKADIADKDAMMALADKDITGIVHLAAQPGVRYSLENPFAYVTANVMGQAVMLELARALQGLKHFVYASSSSVYGANKKTPFAVGDAVDHPNSLYAATKRADELFAHTTSTVSLARGCASSPSTGRGDAPTWRPSCLPAPSPRMNPSRCSTMARCGGTSPMSTTSWRACCARWIDRHRARRRTRFTIWATTSPRN